VCFVCWYFHVYFLLLSLCVVRVCVYECRVCVCVFCVCVRVSVVCGFV